MSTPLTDSIQNLTDYINEITGGEDANLSDAVIALVTMVNSQSSDCDLSWATQFSVVEVPDNTIANTVDSRAYFESENCDFAILSSPISIDRQIVLFFFGAQYRLYGKTIQGVSYGQAYDAKLVAGSKYLLFKRKE